MGPKDDWQVRRPPLTEAQKRRIRAAEIMGEVEDEMRADARYEARKERERRQREERQAAIERMTPMLRDRRSACAGLLLEMLTDVRIRRLDWDNVIIDMTKGYSDAWRTFTKRIELQEQHSAAMAQVAFGVLSAVSAGGLAMLSKHVTNKWLKAHALEVLAAGAEETLQVGIDKAISIAAPGSRTTSDIPLPINYKGALEKVLNDHEKTMLTAVKERSIFLRTRDLESFEHYGVREMEESIASFWSDLDADFKPVSVDPGTLEREIEIGLWARWVGQKMRVQDRGLFMGFIAGDYRYIEGPILDRLYELRLVTKSEYNNIDKSPDGTWYVSKILRRLERWGATWRPSRKFGDPKSRT